jgi:hypothetical protein
MTVGALTLPRRSDYQEQQLSNGQIAGLAPYFILIKHFFHVDAVVRA